MSTSAGSIQKGEKGKSKFQSLDINSLYRGPETEPAQQKGTVPRKNGMQTLGKVPQARRPPINLPSLKSESSGSEPAVSLVPPGSGGWGSKPGEGPPPSQQNAPAASSGSGPPPPVAVPVAPPVVMAPPTHEAVLRGPLPTSADKSWKAVAMGDHNHKLFTQQSPQFQQEFPKLASEGGVLGPQQVKNADAQYGPGPSLRPQTAGSWTAGGGRQQGGGPGAPAAPSLGPGLHMGAGHESGAPRNNLGPHPVAGVPTGPAGLPNHAIPPYRPIPMPFGRGGAFPPNMAQRYPGPNYMMPPRQMPAPAIEGDEPSRPILREEELSKMDEISRDPGWAAHQDIDYNKQLSFSDNEDSQNEPNKRSGDKKDRDDKNRGREEIPDKLIVSQDERGGDWERSRLERGYSNSKSDEEIRKVLDQVAMVSERARQRKDEEAKRFDESRAGNKKFATVDEKSEGGSTLFPEFVGDRPARGDVNDDRPRQGERSRDNRGGGGGRNDRDREPLDREDHDSKSDHKYDRDKYERDPKYNRGGRGNQRSRESGGGYRNHPHVPNLAPRFLQRGESTNNNMIRSTGSPQPAPPAPAGNFAETQWNRRYPSDQEPPVDKRDSDWTNHRERPQPENERFKNGGRDRAYHAPYSEPADHRRHYDRKDREEPDRGLDERESSYKKSRGEWGDPQRHKNDRKESSEEREAWRNNAEQRPDSRDSRSTRESEPRSMPARPDSRDSRVSREDEKERRWSEARDVPADMDALPQRHDRQPPRPDSRDSQIRQPPRPDSRDSQTQRQPPRPDSRDSQPQRPDSRDSRTSRDSRASRDEKMDIDHKPVGRFASNHNQHKEEKQRDERERKEPQNRHGSGPGHRDKQDKKARPTLTQLRSEDNDNELTSSNVDKKENIDALAKGEAKDEKDDKVLSDDGRQKGGKYSMRGARGERDRGGHSSSSNSSYGRAVSGAPVRNERRRRTSDRTSGGHQGSHDEHSESGFANWMQDANSSGEGGSELGKGEKEERNREMQASGREGFAPSGQPSRRGRGSMRVRGGSSTSRRMDGYGPPPSKAPFAQPEHLSAEEDDDPTKQKQAALNAGLASGAARATAAGQPRSQSGRVQRNQNRDSNRGNKQNRATRRGKPVDGEEGDEVLSNSDGEERKIDGRPRRHQGQNRPRPGQPRTAPPVGSSGPSNKSALNDSKEETKPKTGDAESDATLPSGNLEKKKNTKESYKGSGGNKGEIGGRTSGPNKEKRVERTTGKFSNSQPVPPPNPNGPQPLMSKVVNPPPMMQQSAKSHQWRTPHLPPRLMKQQQQQQQAQQEQQQQSAVDIHDMNKLPSSMGMFPTKGETHQSGLNAWDKSLGTGSKNAADQGPSEGSSQRSSPATKLPVVPLLDDSSAPVATIIFENTNFKTGAPAKFSPHMKQAPRVDKESERKPGDELSAVTSFEKPELTAEFLDDPTMKLPVYRPDQTNVIDYNTFNTEFGELTITNNLAKTKKLWEQHGPEEGEEGTTGGGVFQAGFCQDPSMDPSGFGKSVDSNVVADDCSMMHPTDLVYSNTPVMAMGKQDPATSGNVCKVKPQQQTVMSSGHSPLGPAGQSSLSPPPYSSSAQPGPFNYQQAGLGGSAAQFSGISAIPSPPAMLSYSSQQLQPNNLFQAFPVDQARANQFSQYSAPPYGSLGGTSTYNQASLYLQHTAPPNADLYSPSISQYRLQHPSGPFGQSQLNSNPNTVLLTSSTSSLMSASVKPSSQSIGAIGSKGTAFQQNSQQVFIPVDPMQLGLNQSFLSNSGMVQRAAQVPPSAPNFYSNSAGPQTGFFGNPGSTIGQPGPTAPQMQAGYGLQGFGTQSSTIGLQGFSSQSDLFQIGVQQFRTPSAVGPASYLKSGVSSNSSSQQDAMASVFGPVPQIPSPKSRHPKQLSQQTPTQPLPQVPSNKFASYPSSLVMPQQQQQPGGSQQRAVSGGMGLQGMRGGNGTHRYPSPIQRPPANRGRTAPHHRPASKPYYEAQDGNIKLEETNDLNKADDASPLNCDSKLNEVKGDLIEEDSANSAKE